MAFDPILNLVGLDFPQLDRSTRRMIGWYSWCNQISLPLAAGMVALHKRDYEGFLRMALAVGINQVCLELLKTWIPEVRPNGTSKSFPSGDTAAACLGPAFIAFRYGVKAYPWITKSMIIVAITVAVSRVLIKAHWVHDVAAGAVLGCAVAYLCMGKVKNSGKR